MSDVLTKICADKWETVKARQAAIPQSELESLAKDASPTRGFAAHLKHAVDQGGFGLIAEIKKASPSKGLIRDDFDPPALAKAYAAGGASCLSVLTDEPYFQGHDSYLRAAHNAVALPVLRKDFMLDPYQIVEARSLGADCILLIMAALSDTEADELELAAMEWGMDVLIEVHDREELDRALMLRSELIGINNRNLKTLEVNLATSEELSVHMPDDVLGVCESGLSGPEQLARMSAVGLNCFLIGESLMRQDDVEQATRRLLDKANKSTAA